MNVPGSGYILIINYGVNSAAAFIQEFSIMTENNLDILTESGNNLVTEAI